MSHKNNLLNQEIYHFCLWTQVAADGDPERLVPIPDSDHHVRLVDHAFSQICNMVNDISVRVRTKAASLLGNMTCVSERFLAQTLDKKLMSNMRVGFMRACFFAWLFVLGRRWRIYFDTL